MVWAWGKLRGALYEVDHERRLVELIAQLIDAGRAAEGRGDTPPQPPWEQLTREAYLGFRSEFGDGFESKLLWIF